MHRIWMSKGLNGIILIKESSQRRYWLVKYFDQCTKVRVKQLIMYGQLLLCRTLSDAHYTHVLNKLCYDPSSCKTW